MTTPRTTGHATPAQHHELTAADVGAVVTRHGIATVEPVIRPYLRHTPAITVDRADFGLPPGPLVLKLEQLQHGGSFKARGAFANLLLRDVPAAGVVAASGGNHGAAIAFAARALGIPAHLRPARLLAGQDRQDPGLRRRPGGHGRYLL
jgi:tryptophan synthase beta subunit